MMRLDSRSGSGELMPLFRPYGLEPVLSHLEFGDAQFSGHGPTGECLIAVERKKISDLVSSINNDRLAGHQLPGMARAFDYIYLVCEGIWRASRTGDVEIRSGSTWFKAPITSRHLNGFLTSLEAKAGVIVRRSTNAEETVSMMIDLYRWWQKDWAAHMSHDRVYSIQATNSDGGRMVTYSPRDISLVEKVALQLPGLDEKARFAARRWPTIRSMMGASEEDWADLPWTDKNGKERRLGEVTAKKIIGAICGKS